MTNRSTFFSRYFGSFAAVGIAAAMTVAAVDSASAGPFRFLFGGGGANKVAYSQNASGKRVVSFSKRYSKGTIIVSFADRKLYFVSKPGQAISYPIGAPMGKASWSGVLRVSRKQVNPTWTPTADMRRENPQLPAFVPGGHPRNPLGIRALYLGSTLYRIHGTDAPWTIGQEVSRGCIRMYNRDVVDLYSRVPVGTKVIVTWDRFSRRA